MSQRNSGRVERSYVQLLHARPDRVFPLLCPAREYEWIEPWQCDLVYSSSGVAEPHCVFTTRFPDDSSDEVWVISRYEPNRLIEFVRVNADRVICYRNRSAFTPGMMPALSPLSKSSFTARFPSAPRSRE